MCMYVCMYKTLHNHGAEQVIRRQGDGQYLQTCNIFQFFRGKQKPSPDDTQRPFALILFKVLRNLMFL